MDRAEIRVRVEDIIQGLDCSTEALNSYINQSILYIGARVEIPRLKRIGVAETIPFQAYTYLDSLTNGFSGTLRRIKNSGKDSIKIFSNLGLLMDKYPTMDEVGSVEAVALEGSTLWYQRMPEAIEILTVLCYEDPAVLTGDKDVPSDFPDHLHEDLLVHGAAWMAYDQEGDKVNAEDHFWLSFNESNKRSAINKLREWLARTRRHNISDNWSE